MIRATRILRQQANTKVKQSLALSVYFKQPDFGMQDYEILSRASCFLLGVDPKESTPQGPYSHLEASEKEREMKKYKKKHQVTPATGGNGRKMIDMGWLEFVPREHRPQVHIVASSHVLSPFLWRDYYPQEWLAQVRQDHCTYSLEVFDETNPETALAKFALNSQPYHHPEGRDIALIHLRDEQESLKILQNLGVNIHHFRDPDKLFEKGEEMVFDGFVVSERNKADNQDFQKTGNDENEDTRVFYPYKEKGNLAFHTDDRFFASTPEPLPEGLCGAPVLDRDGDLCGTVEGIVPVGHKDKRLAGSAAFIPSYIMHAFVDFVERGLLQQIMPKDLFEMVEIAKKTNSVGGGVFKADDDGNYTTESNWEEVYNAAINKIKDKCNEKEIDAIMKTIERERNEVFELMEKEGGDMDEAIERVRTKTLQMKEIIRKEYEKSSNS